MKLNKPQNECPQCKGIGSAYKLDETKIINVKARLEEIPILPLKEYESFRLLFLEFCKYRQLDLHKTFETLSKEQQNLLLYVDESPLFTIKYRHNKKARTRNLKYKGAMSYMQDKLYSNKISIYKEALKYSKEIPCEACNGGQK
ncbi:hypothetical protein LS73_004720 [Helicobacter muridarum]|uniref:Excinuclease ABC subunit A n=1 Tax=Helicobacter muridarum TaxID=216 RepID=A0A099U1R8_9HELI|nr:hypothetical protein [Helicobacter muridarum]TLE00488.1 hypothetical protein LS73_004720 [Helicobacter muridarum]STQ86464.1 excinuclease ABC subunit A [Helicobacter muridarum]